MHTPPLGRLPLRWRVALGYALFLVAIITAVGLFLLSALENDLLREADDALGLRANHIEREITTDGKDRLDQSDVAAALSGLAPLDEFSEPGIYIQVLDAAGATLASSPNLPGGELPGISGVVTQSLAGHESHATVKAGQERIRLLAQPVEQQGRVIGVVMVAESLHLVDVTLRRMQQLLVVAASSAALIALLGGWALTTRAFGPITQVTRLARQIAETGKFEQRLAVPPARDELGELVATFNDMLARLERTFRRQREFLGDASHELRGPLMVIRGNLDLLKLDLPAQARQESAREATEEVERMSRLVSDLLFLTEVDAEELVERHPVELHQVVQETFDRAKALDDSSHELSLDINEPTLVRGDRERLGQMLWNLAQNALRYTPAGGRITLSLRNYGRVAELTVADTGIGMSREHLPRIFDRFYRVDRARSRNQDSTGVGLAIVKRVVEAHGGQVRVRSEAGEGSVFTVALPVLEG